jgi:predicted small integral membrane protein
MPSERDKREAIYALIVAVVIAALLVVLIVNYGNVRTYRGEIQIIKHAMDRNDGLEDLSKP